MSSKTFQKLVRGGNRASISATNGAPCARRTFTSSPMRLKHGAVPTFAPSSTPELQTLMDNLRELYVMPKHLREDQQSMIRKPKNKSLLQNEGLIANIHGEEFKLKYMPSTPLNIQKTITSILNLMKKEDMDNLPNLFTSINEVGYVNGEWIDMATNRAALLGRQDIILACLRQVKDTGFKLYEKHAAADIMFAFHQKALVSDWNLEETEKALSWSEAVIEMSGDPKYKAWDNFQFSPFTRGPVLDIAATRAVKHKGGKDEDGKVLLHAKRLLHDRHLPRAFEAGKRQRRAQEYLPGTPRWIYQRTVVLHGMKNAQSILGISVEAGQDLKSLIPECEDKLAEFRRGYSEYLAANPKPATSHFLAAADKMLEDLKV